MHAQSASVENSLAHTKLETALAENQSQSTSIASLPSDILSCIFQKHRGIDRGSQSNDDTQPSIRVSHVSTTWREVALSSPTLWTNIVSSPTHLKDFYDAVLLRSQQSLLNVTITLTENDVASSKAVESAGMLAEIIVSHAHRLYTLHITATNDFLSIHIPAMHALSAPRMTELELESSTTDTFDDVPVLIDLDDDSESEPVIKQIFNGGAGSLSDFSSRNIPWHIQPPLSEIKTLHLNSSVLTCKVLNDVLRDASRMVTHMEIATLNIFSPQQSPPSITMSSLLSAELTGTSASCFTLLGMIEGPSMVELRMGATRPSSSHVLDRTAKRFPKLRSLELIGRFARGVLVAFPTVACLYLADIAEWPQDTSDILDPNQAGFSDLLPGLEWITTSSKHSNAVIAFCEARHSQGLSIPQIMSAVGF